MLQIGMGHSATGKYISIYSNLCNNDAIKWAEDENGWAGRAGSRLIGSLFHEHLVLAAGWNTVKLWLNLTLKSDTLAQYHSTLNSHA